MRSRNVAGISFAPVPAESAVSGFCESRIHFVERNRAWAHGTTRLSRRSILRTPSPRAGFQTLVAAGRSDIENSRDAVSGLLHSSDGSLG